MERNYSVKLGRIKPPYFIGKTSWSTPHMRTDVYKCLFFYVKIESSLKHKSIKEGARNLADVIKNTRLRYLTNLKEAEA